MKKAVWISQLIMYYGIGILLMVFMFSHSAFYTFPPDLSKIVPLNWMAINVGAFIVVIFFIIIEESMEADDRYWLERHLRNRK